jgi:hypothetical protein
LCATIRAWLFSYFNKLPLQRFVNCLAPVRTWGMNAYSKDLRLRVLDAVDRDLPRREVATGGMGASMSIEGSADGEATARCSALWRIR